MSKPHTYVQVDLSHRPGPTWAQDTHMTCWLKDAEILHPGIVISLKGDERKWVVMRIYSTLLDHPPSSDWHVGGL